MQQLRFKSRSWNRNLAKCTLIIKLNERITFLNFGTSKIKFNNKLFLFKYQEN